jgi:glutamate racemase
MLGFFDSGFGGLSVVREIQKALPLYSTIYIGDNARTPYGSRSRDVIYQYTLEGVTALFRRGADLIVLACNTSSSVALRRIQQEYLPSYDTNKRVLGIVIPTAELVSQSSHTKVIGILATEATVGSLAYPQEIQKIDHRVAVHQQACPLLVPMIESGELDNIETVVKQYVDRLLQQSSQIDTILLGCTHYALIEDVIRTCVPPGIRVVSQGSIVADKLADYLRRHPEMERRLDKASRHTFLTTEYSERVHRLGTQFFGRPISIDRVVL